MIRKSRYTEEVLNSGILEYGTYDRVRDAQGKLSGLPVFNATGPVLYFSEMQVRSDDYDLFMGRSLAETMKVKTYYLDRLEPALKVRIDGLIYDIVSTDVDPSKHYRYWYLARMK